MQVRAFESGLARAAALLRARSTHDPDVRMALAQVMALRRALPKRVHVEAPGPDSRQLVLRLVWVLEPHDVVPCKVGGTLEVKACLTRRAKVYPSGGATGGIGGPKGRPVVLECLGCPLGASYASRAPWFVPPKPSRAAEVLSPEQRAAKARWQAEHGVDDQDWMDPLREAAMLSPDDRGV